MHDSHALSVSGLDVWRGEAHILHGVSFALKEGEVTALLGRNGVGKTTTLLAIMGLVSAAGSIQVGNTELVGMPTHQIARLGIGYVPEDREVFSALTVAENLKLAARPDQEHRYDLVYDLFPDIASRLGQTAGSLSGGQQQMLAIARALLNPNRLLLVDEPTKGLAPIVVEHVMSALRRAAEHTTVVLVEQNLVVATDLATDAVVLDQGRVVHVGNMDALASDAELTGRFLGVEVR
jgi:branched-chain amino acid transport system ATP-binding protein